MVIKLYNESPNAKEIDRLAKILRDGGIIIYPTDTIYAIGCNALDVKAIDQICKIKKINPERTLLSIVCGDISELSQYAKLSNDNFKLLKANLPGAFTFILPTSNTLPKVFRSRKTVGVRIPNNNIVLALVQELGTPILTTSIPIDINEPENSSDPELIAERYEHLVDAIVDGGIGDIIPSTIIDCTEDIPHVIRQGKGELILS